jgi:tetratricopeptide (TPR) repeat protein
MSYEDSYNKGLNEIIIYMQMNRYHQAINKLQQMLSDKPNDETLLHFLAECYYQIKSFTEAEEYCRESMANGISPQLGNDLLGRIYMDMGQFLKSEEYFLEALRIDATEASTFAAYSILMLRCGLKNKAEALMNEAIRIDPEDAAVLHYEYLFHLLEDDRAGLLNSIEKLLSNSDNEVGNQIRIGLYNYRNKNYVEARENFRQAFLLNPTSKELLLALEILDKETHWAFLPNRLAEKFGGAAVVWTVFFILIVGSSFINSRIMGILVSLYLIFVISTWLSPILYRVISRAQSKSKLSS